MEMLQLRYFYESALNESFSKTAQKYMVPTASVSASVRRLEEELGVKLFDRTSNSIVLNDKGRQFLQSVGQIFYELDSASSAMRDDGTDNKKIKILAKGMRQRTTRRIVEYSSLHPNQAFEVNIDFKENDYDKYDIIIAPKNDEHPEYECFELCRFKLKIEASKYSPLCQKKLTLSQLRNQPFVTTSRHNEIYKALTRACNRAGFEPNFIMECNDYDCIDMVERAGMGLGVTVELGAASFGMQYLDVSDFDESYVIYVYYKKQAYHGNVKSFIDYLQATIN
ncbi:MAG: LysR family transcriptional regulator [Oscillospiraceae bacterium]|nr:LysR family transcriptional regulator [Oscillospiraceae bacterium]